MPVVLTAEVTEPEFWALSPIGSSPRGTNPLTSDYLLGPKKGLGWETLGARLSPSPANPLFSPGGAVHQPLVPITLVASPVDFSIKFNTAINFLINY